MSVSLRKVERASASDAGCWIDGHWGQYAIARLVQIAAQCGYRGDVEDTEGDLADIASRHLASIGPSDSDGITDDEWDTLHYGADDAESWLNTYVAPAGFSFGWHDGEFFLWADACEQCGEDDNDHDACGYCAAGFAEDHLAECPHDGSWAGSWAGAY